MPSSPPRGLAPSEFFELGLDGCSKNDAHFATRLAYSTIHDIARGVASPRILTMQRLEQWSRVAGAPHGVFISTAMVCESVLRELAKAVGE